MLNRPHGMTTDPQAPLQEKSIYLESYYLSSGCFWAAAFITHCFSLQLDFCVGPGINPTEDPCRLAAIEKPLGIIQEKYGQARPTGSDQQTIGKGLRKAHKPNSPLSTGFMTRICPVATPPAVQNTRARTRALSQQIPAVLSNFDEGL